MKSTDGVSLGRELELIRFATEGVRILVSEIAHDHLLYPASERAALYASEHLLALLAGRVELLGRVCEGELDPRVIRTKFSTVAAEHKHEEAIVLDFWSNEDRQKRAAAILKFSGYKDLEGEDNG